jgi:hypothetical protein
MAQDPYGYTESVSTSPENAASTAMWSGVISVICAMMGPCMCYFPYMIAWPLGAYAMYSGYAAYQNAQGHERNMAMAGLVTGTAAFSLTTLVLLAIIAYIGLYVVLFGFMAVAAALGQH